MMCMEVYDIYEYGARNAEYAMLTMASSLSNVGVQIKMSHKCAMHLLNLPSYLNR